MLNGSYVCFSSERTSPVFSSCLWTVWLKLDSCWVCFLLACILPASRTKQWSVPMYVKVHLGVGLESQSALYFSQSKCCAMSCFLELNELRSLVVCKPVSSLGKAGELSAGWCGSEDSAQTGCWKPLPERHAPPAGLCVSLSVECCILRPRKESKFLIWK